MSAETNPPQTPGFQDATPQEPTVNPYERFDDGQLVAIKANLLDSVAGSINNSEELEMASSNLMNVVREIDGRLPADERRLDVIDTDENSFGHGTLLEAADTDALVAKTIENGTSVVDVLRRHFQASDAGDKARAQGDNKTAQQMFDAGIMFRQVGLGLISARAEGWDDYRVDSFTKVVLAGEAEAAQKQGSSLQVEQATLTTPEAPAKTPDSLRMMGTKREISPRLQQLAENPGSLSPSEKTEALKEAERETGRDARQNKVIVNMNGEPYWGGEFPNAFAFNDYVRGRYEEHPNEEGAELTAAQALSGPGGKFTHVIIETDDGHAFLISRTKNTMHEKGSASQQFQVTSTKLNSGLGDGGPKTDSLYEEQLKDIVVLPGHPLTLGKNPVTGKGIRTEGNVLRVTAVQKTEDGKVLAGHPFLEQQERYRDAPDRFIEGLKTARTMDAASKVGPMIVKSVAEN